jgi:tetratricopeptide (TPR) repeat protein
VLAEAFYWYTRTCNEMAAGEGIKKPQPVYFDNTIGAGGKLAQKLKYGSSHRYALLARLEVADALAAREDYDSAVGIAGEALSAARVAGQRRVGRTATAKLTQWVANVAGAGALEPGLLYQIGESLAAQGRTANAITFYEKAVASSATDEMKEKWAYPARLRIARVYRNDKRYFASSEVAWKLVEEYLETGQDEDTPFGQTASEACNTARLAWKTISGLTERSADNARYQSILKTFQEKFPGHPDNSDAAFGGALDVFNDGKYEMAADRLRDISPSSRNYWRAQRMVPVCYRRLATSEEDAAKAKEWHEKCLKSAQELVNMAGAKGDDSAAQRSRQYGHLYVAMSLASLERWTEAITSMKDYLLRYPKDLLKHGLEYDILVHGYLATDALPLAEQTLAVMKQKVPGSSYIPRSNFDVFDALRTLYRKVGKGDPEYKMIAGRAARIWEERLGTIERPKVSDLAIFGEVLAAAQEFEAAADAYEGASELETSPKARVGYTLRAAQNAFKAAKLKKKMGGSNQEYQKVIEKTRKLMTDVLIEDKSQQETLIKILGNYSKWLSKDQWRMIKRNAEVLLNAAEVYAESGVKGGIDGRVVAIRLIDHLQSFTRPIPDPVNPDPKLEEFIDEWWDGAQLKLELAVAISGTDSGQKAKSIRGKAYSYGKKLLFQYPKADGPERVKKIDDLVNRLK